jgi:ABC-2 type transport system permease protein
MRRFLLASATLWQREWVRFFRQRSRVIGALGPPILFWFLIGSGLGASFRLNTTLAAPASGTGANYLQYFFPGTVALIVLFTAIFSTISIIEDRHEGFLQSVLVAPISRASLVLGKIAGGTTLAFAQALIFLCFAPLVHLSISAGGLLFVAVMLLLVSFSLTGLGFLLAWQLDSTQGFHAIMNLFLIPMWLLSGALFPIQGAPRWLQTIMRVNPLTYSLSALQSSFLANGQPLAPGVASPAVCLASAAAFGALMFLLCVHSVRKS